MPPKKAANQAAKPKVEVPQCGLLAEPCPLPLWDDHEAEKEAFGDLTVAHVDPSLQFVDADAPPAAAFQAVPGIEWRRPNAVFSPFKPVVARPSVPTANPYEYNPPAPGAASDDEDDEDAPRPQSRAEMVALYRTMRAFRAVGADDDAATTRRGQSHAARRRERQLAPTPYFMRAFNSALMVVNQAQTLLPAGAYAWELIYPQSPAHLPMYNPHGKYIVKLYVNGAQRRVVIDDRLPTDAFGQCILTVTESKEIWPALLAKAVLKALGSHHEALLVNSPVFLVQTLMGGWFPTHICPRREEALAFRALRTAVARMRALREHIASATELSTTSGMQQQPPTPTPPQGGGGASTPKGFGASVVGQHAERPSGAIAIATCNDSTRPTAPEKVVEDHAVAAGLQCRQAFYVLDIRPFQNTNLVRLCSPGCNWHGAYAYDSESWSSEVEEAIGFHAATDRSHMDTARKWNDFWLPWESFIKFFTTLSVFGDGSSKTWPVFKQFNNLGETPSAAAADAPPAPTGKGGSKADREKDRAQAAVAAAAAVEGRCRDATKWISFNLQQAEPVTITLLGFPQPPPPETQLPGTEGNSNPPPPPVAATKNETSSTLTTTITVERFQWTAPDPLTPILQFAASDGIMQSRTITVPPGPNAYRITATTMYAGNVVSIMARKDFTMGNQKEVCRDVLHVHTIRDAGVYGEHVPETPTIWFKRLFTVKQLTHGHFSVGTLPKGTDLTKHKEVPEGAQAPGGKGGKGDKGAKPPAKGKNAVPEPTAADLDALIDDEPHDRPITDFVQLSLIDLDTGIAMRDTVGRIMGCALEPNRAGYILVARATSPSEHYKRGYWKLSCTTDRPLETFEPRLFDEAHTRQGEYHLNDQRSLFRYNLIAGEPATATVQLLLPGGDDVPIKMTVHHNERILETVECTGSAHLPHLTLTPAEKTSPSVYSVRCTIEEQYIRQWEEERREQVTASYRQSTAAQKEALLQKQSTLRTGLAQNPEFKLEGAPPPQPGSSLQAFMPDASRSKSPAGQAAVIAASASMLAARPPSTEPIDVIPIRYTLSVHASSPKVEVKEDVSLQEAVSAIKHAWSKKDDVPAGSPAKGSKGGGKDKQQAEDSTVRFAKAREARERFLANRLGVYVPHAEPSTGKVFLSAADEDKPHRFAPPAPPTEAVVPNRIHGGFAADGGALVAGFTSAEEPTTTSQANLSEVLAAPKPNMKGDLERLHTEFAAGIRADRKAAFGAMVEISNGFFSQIRADRPSTEPQPDEDKKKKRGGK